MLSATTSEFEPYGYLLEGDFSDVVAFLNEKSALPEHGNIYVRDEKKMRFLPSTLRIQAEVFGCGEMESGYCNGDNRKLNCMEFHACPEVDVAAEDMVLLLGLPSDIRDGKFHSQDAKAFLIKKGQAVVLRPYVMHFSPCMVGGKKFRSAVYLSLGTNRDLLIKPKDPLLWKENKWLLAHPESKQAAMGAYIGIEGPNIEI